METYWVLTNQALTEVYLRVVPTVALEFPQFQQIIGQMLDQPKVMGLSMRADLGEAGFLVATQTHAGLVVSFEISWEPPNRLAAIQESPEFLEAERHAEILVSLIALLVWRYSGGHITDLHGRDIPAADLFEAVGLGAELATRGGHHFSNRLLSEAVIG